MREVPRRPSSRRPRLPPTRRSLGAAIIFFGAFFLCAARPVITLGTSAYYPYTGVDLPRQGVVAALVNAALSHQGYDVHIVFLPWTRVLTEVRNGRFDGIFPVWPLTVERNGLVGSPPLFQSELGLYVRAGQRRQPSSLEGIRGKTVGTVRAYGYPLGLLDGILRDDAPDDPHNLIKLADGRFDQALEEHLVAEYLLRTQLSHLAGRVIWQPPGIVRLPLMVGFSKGKPGHDRYLNDLTQGLEAIRKTGEYDQLVESNMESWQLDLIRQRTDPVPQ
ncbi:MAG: transporter substrate-binding domain-containing protein [Telmatospirillum sp.]|nr:transporter substrate-binding domain-containing protein [Telmatospirillum sp.]